MVVWTAFLIVAVYFGFLGVRIMRQSIMAYKSIIVLWKNPGLNYTRYADFWMGVILTGSAIAYILTFIIYMVNK